MRRCAALLIVALALACEGGKSPTSPEESLVYGRLSGAVTIGPNCPAEQPGNPCPPPPGAYSLRKVRILDAAGTRQLFQVDIDGRGFYAIDLVPGEYTVDLVKSGADSSPDVPAKVTIRANAATRLDIRIDTGIR